MSSIHFPLGFHCQTKIISRLPVLSWCCKKTRSFVVWEAVALVQSTLSNIRHFSHLRPCCIERCFGIPLMFPTWHKSSTERLLLCKTQATLQKVFFLFTVHWQLLVSSYSTDAWVWLSCFEMHSCLKKHAQTKWQHPLLMELKSFEANDTDGSDCLEQFLNLCP